ncbi:hypothetical protein [Thalassotalea hakodatensis]|uniref:hypothetical protein n=1 Tax=Thalassotalea hakodatensis TaxID=3030492 RepID=UPI0025723879|nr:hypothetical protein [Thalassotalea hakodatensis]
MSMSKKSTIAAMFTALAMASVFTLPAKAENNINPFEIENVQFSGSSHVGHEGGSCGEGADKKDKKSCGEGMKHKDKKSCGEGMKHKDKKSCGEGMKHKDKKSCGEGAMKKKPRTSCGENHCGEGSKKKMKKMKKDNG